LNIKIEKIEIREKISETREKGTLVYRKIEILERITARSSIKKIKN
jgi:hypothetical protein